MNSIRHGKLENGDKVEIYRNLHNNTFSVRLLGAEDEWDTKRWRDVGKVVKHLINWMTLHLKDVKFAVQPAGREKVRREGKKNVHAYIRGTVEKLNDGPVTQQVGAGDGWQIVNYNPYRNDTFVTQGWSSNPCSIHKASKVTLNQGTVYAAI